MPKNPLPGLPFPPLEVLDQDAPIRVWQIQALLSNRQPDAGLSLLLRSKRGHLKRGGYFFHIKKPDPFSNIYELFDFQERKVASMNEDDLVLLINHCAGREFSIRSYVVCQNEINLHDDLQ